MDFISFISLIAAVASLLLIVFKISGQISISKEVFILLLIIIVGGMIVFVVKPQSYNPTVIQTDSSKNSGKDDTKPKSSIFNGQNDSDEQSVTYTEAYSESVESIIETAIKNNTMITVENIEDYPVEINPTFIMELSGEIVDKDQCDEYGYVAQISGMHRFEFSKIPNGTDVTLKIYNSGREQIESAYNLDNGEGLSIELAAGETYYISVEQYNNVGPYTLNIGAKKEIADITEYTMVSDSIQYTDQENDYMYIAKRTGKHRFEFSQIPNGTDVTLKIYNSGWEQMDSAYNLDNGEGLSIELTAGETYYIRVEQYNNVGSYTLNIGAKKEIADITEYTMVSDSIQYTDQENDYMYVSKRTGKHNFKLLQVPNGTDVTLKIYNSGWEQMDSAYDLDNGEGLSIELTAGETYYIRVEQYNNIGTYIFDVTL